MAEEGDARLYAVPEGTVCSQCSSKDLSNYFAVRGEYWHHWLGCRDCGRFVDGSITKHEASTFTHSGTADERCPVCDHYMGINFDILERLDHRGTTAQAQMPGISRVCTKCRHTIEILRNAPCCATERTAKHYLALVTTNDADLMALIRRWLETRFSQ